jgi:hypothetical protein
MTMNQQVGCWSHPGRALFFPPEKAKEINDFREW